MSKNIVLCGIGGQGTVLASQLIAKAAMDEGYMVMSAGTIGMAQRGGSVFSHLRIGNDVKTPMIEKKTADCILAFEPGEAVRMVPYLKEKGTIILSNKVIMPVTAAIDKKQAAEYTSDKLIEYLKKVTDKVVVIDTDRAIAEIGSPKAMNVIMLGAALHTGVLGISEETVKAAIKERLPEKLHEMNLKALSWYRDRA